MTPAPNERRLFSVWRNCPMCGTRDAVELRPGPANFYRCHTCRQAIKVHPDGTLGPWLDITTAGRRNRTRQHKKR